MSNTARKIVIVLLVVLNIGCDQVSKNLVRERVSEDETIQLMDDYFIMTKVENSGAFLGLGSELPEWLRVGLLLVIPALMMVGLLIFIWLKRKQPLMEAIGMSFVIGGGIGNVFDRIAYGSVTDFFHIDLGWARTGIFNMADVSVMVGVGLLLLNMATTKKPKKKLETPEPELETGQA